MFASPTGRGDADDLFAKKVLPIRVYDQKNDSGLGLDLSRADRMPALLARFVDAVWAHEAARVFECQRG